MDSPRVDPEKIIVDSIKFSELTSCPDFGGRYGRHLSEFLTDIFCRLSPVEESSGRRYQRETIKNSGLGMISPISGKLSVSRQSFVIQGIIFYRFAEANDFYVAAGRIKFGFPLLALFVPRGNSLLKWEIGNDKRGVTRTHVTKLAGMVANQAIEPTHSQTSFPPRTTSAILFGHQNFAHHLWNELPALERLLADNPPDPPPRMIVNREPLGAIDRIFPEISRWIIIRDRDREAPFARQSPGLYVHLGSYRVSASVRRRIVRYATANASPSMKSQIDRIRKSEGPVFWLSLRLQNPTLINQTETLTTIAARLLDEFCNCHILFDGFSPPDDWQSCGDDNRELYRSAAEASRRAIDEIMGLVLSDCPGAAPQLVNGGGVGILDSIALAQCATAYFCHVGTVQHKIGWTTATPGMVHANRGIVSRKSAIWYAPSRLEDGTMPDPVEPDTVSAAGREENYHILDVGRVARLVVENFRRYSVPIVGSPVSSRFQEL